MKKPERRGLTLAPGDYSRVCKQTVPGARIFSPHLSFRFFHQAGDSSAHRPPTKKGFRTLFFAERGRSEGGAIRNGAGLLANPRQAPVSATPNCGPAKSNLRMVLVAPFDTKRCRSKRSVLWAKESPKGSAANHRSLPPKRRVFVGDGGFKGVPTRFCAPYGRMRVKASETPQRSGSKSPLPPA